MQTINKFSLNTIAVFTLLMGMNSLVLAEDNMANAEIIKYRQNVMTSQRGHMGAAAAIIQGKVVFKDQLQAHVSALADTSKQITSLFPKGTEMGETKALKEVWSNNEEFLKRAKDTQQKAEALAKAVADGDSMNYGPRLKDLGETCKNCHKDFRKKEEK